MHFHQRDSYIINTKVRPINLISLQHALTHQKSEERQMASKHPGWNHVFGHVNAPITCDGTNNYISVSHVFSSPWNELHLVITFSRLSFHLHIYILIFKLPVEPHVAWKNMFFITVIVIVGITRQRSRFTQRGLCELWTRVLSCSLSPFLSLFLSLFVTSLPRSEAQAWRVFSFGVFRLAVNSSIHKSWTWLRFNVFTLESLFWAVAIFSKSYYYFLK